MSIEKTLFAKTSDGIEVDLYTMTNSAGLKLKVMTYGATITAVEVPDRDGKLDNVTLYLESGDQYLAGHPYFGATCGRFAGRIAKGKFMLDGVEYSLSLNDGPNHLHGGEANFARVVWRAEPVETENSAGVAFSYESADGEEGYPGKFNTTVTYSLTDDNELKMHYTARTDKPTIVNLTNHAYWNLGGATSGDILDHQLTLNCDRFLVGDKEVLPTGELAPVAGTPMDFTKPEAIGARIKQVDGGGYDHCYELNRAGVEGLVPAARIFDPKSGRVMEIETTQPGVVLYTGNYLGGDLSAGGVAYQKHAAVCLETEHYPDSPNRPEFPSTVLRPGETFEHLTVHKFSVE